MQEPLRKIANFSEMLAKQYQGQLDERAVRYFGYVTDGAKRMQALINDLLNYSRVGRAELPLIPTSLEEILKGTLNDLHALIKENHAEISHDPLPTLKVNPHQVGQLLQNLIANAIKFHGDQPPRIHLSARQEGREWLVAVRDNGIGFDPQYAEGIFKVFKRLHTKEQYPGTGIGLAICKKIVERHGGRIWAESEPGRGCHFLFHHSNLRGGRINDTRIGGNSPGGRRPRGRGTDAVYHRRNPRSMIDLHVVGDGVEALAFLRREGKYADAPRPDLILLDLNMPRMDGRTFLSEMRADDNLKAIPVVVLTTSQTDEDILKSYQLGANCYITKPVGLAEFSKVVYAIEDFWFTIVRLPQR